MGQDLTYWTIRIATLLYALALITRKRPLWTAAWALYIVHVVCAFQFFHAWSHSAAYRETARRTYEMLGVANGSGIYWNYVFTVVWTLDVAWWWFSPANYAARNKWINRTIHGFLAFMFFNAVIVFGSTPTRWAGLFLLCAILTANIRRIKSV